MHGAHYAGIVREKALLRQLIAASNDILRDAYAPHEKADLVLDKAEKKSFDIAQKKVGGAISSLGDVAMEVYEMLEEKGRRGIETSFFELDDMLNGASDAPSGSFHSPPPLHLRGRMKKSEPARPRSRRCRGLQ